MPCCDLNLDDYECVLDTVPQGIANAGVLIVGASSGIGKQTAIAYAKRGNSVVVAARRQDKLDALVLEIAGISGAGPAYAVVMDATDEAQVTAGLSAATTWLAGAGGGRLLNRVLVFTGQDQVGRFNNNDLEASKKIFDMNYWSVRNVLKHVVPALKTTFATNEDVRLYITSSSNASITSGSRDVYGPAKAALTRLANQVEYENPFLSGKMHVGYWGPVNTELYWKPNVAEDSVVGEPGATGPPRWCPGYDQTNFALASGVTGAALDVAMIFSGVVTTQFSMQPSFAAEVAYNHIELGRKNIHDTELIKLGHRYGYFNETPDNHILIYSLAANLPSGFTFPPLIPAPIYVDPNGNDEPLITSFTRIVKNKLTTNDCYLCKQKAKLNRPKTFIQTAASKLKSLDKANALICVALEEEINAFYEPLKALGYPLIPEFVAAIPHTPAIEAQLDGLDYVARTVGFPLEGSAFSPLKTIDGNYALRSPTDCPYTLAVQGTLLETGLTPIDDNPSLLL